MIPYFSGGGEEEFSVMVFDDEGKESPNGVAKSGLRNTKSVGKSHDRRVISIDPMAESLREGSNALF